MLILCGMQGGRAGACKTMCAGDLVALFLIFNFCGFLNVLALLGCGRLLVVANTGLPESSLPALCWVPSGLYFQAACP